MIAGRYRAIMLAAIYIFFTRLHHIYSFLELSLKSTQQIRGRFVLCSNSIINPEVVTVKKKRIIEGIWFKVMYRNNFCAYDKFCEFSHIQPFLLMWLFTFSREILRNFFYQCIFALFRSSGFKSTSKVPLNATNFYNTKLLLQKQANPCGSFRRKQDHRTKAFNDQNLFKYLRTNVSLNLF